MSNALTANQFCWHNQLLRCQVRLIDSPKNELCEVNAEFLGELSNRSQPRMQNVPDCVVEACHTDVVRNAYARFLQCLVHPGGSLIRSSKQRCRTLAIGKQGFHCQVS